MAKDGWSPGLVGVVASRLSNRHYRPVVVIGLDADGGGRGSCRSISALNMVETLEVCSSHLEQFGGHQMAAGLRLKAGSLDSFKATFEAAAQARLAGQELQREQRIDAWIAADEVNETLMDTINRMEPFGMGNPKPVWGLRAARLEEKPRVLKEKHLKMAFVVGSDRLEGIAFNRAADWGSVEGCVDVAFQLDRNEFRGQITLQALVQDLRQHKVDEYNDGAGV